MKKHKMNKANCNDCKKKDCWSRSHNQFRGIIMCLDFEPYKKKEKDK